MPTIDRPEFSQGMLSLAEGSHEVRRLTESADWTGKRAACAGRVWSSMVEVVLLAAAGLKAASDSGGAVGSVGLAAWLPFRLGLIWLEVALGCWLLAGVHRRPARRVAISCFGAFAIVALVLELRGTASCGCFGNLHVRPLYTFAFDCAAAIGLWLAPAAGEPTLRIVDAPARAMAALSAALLMGGLLTIAAVRGPAAIADTEGFGPADGSPVALDPEAWRGKAFPLLGHLEFDAPGATVDAGSWLVVLYRSECSHCRELVPKILAWADQEPTAHVVFVEIPPTGPSGERTKRFTGAANGRVVSGRLDASHEWFVQTPSLIQLRNGFVSRASGDPLAIAIATQSWASTENPTGIPSSRGGEP